MYKQGAIYKALDAEHYDRREKSRVSLRCRALVRLQNGVTFPAEVRDISANAAQIVCDARFALLVSPSGEEDDLHRSAPLDLAIALPGDKVHEFRTRCRVKYCAPNREQRNHMILGLRFLGVDFGLLKKLEPILEATTAIPRSA
ncbi:MAG: PilZ domain-containing protein [Pseudomonadota bacterium]